MNPLLELKRLGQSVWYDHLRRGLLESGELKRMTDDYAVTGVTSNPTIFERAVSGTDEYDKDILDLAGEGLEAAQILERLIVKDIKKACDLLAPVHRMALGADGFVSVEVNPALARNASQTMKEARRLFDSVGKPNLMVKVPGTGEGLKAIEELTYEGRNINVTLLFSVGRYEEVAWAYIRGLERRLSEGLPVDNIFSVASFFVSRVDTLTDKKIEERVDRSKSNDEKARLKGLLGRAGIANSALALGSFNEIFSSDRFKALEAAGARPQKLLWASTGTKNPNYPDVKYVEGLFEPGTVITMPLATLLAFYDHGKAKKKLSEEAHAAPRVFEELESLGIGFGQVTADLEEEGIRIFSDSFSALLECVKRKREELVGKRVRAIGFAVNGFRKDIDAAVGQVKASNFLERLWAKDPTLWKTAPDDKKIIKNALGWLTLPDVMEENVAGIVSFAEEVRKAGFKYVVLLGMGGSSLAPLVMNETFGRTRGFPRLIVLDSTDPEAVKSVDEEVDLTHSLFIVSSKSGSTIEPLSLFEYFYGRLKEKKGEAAGENFIAITDPGTPLEGFSKKYGFRRVFLNPRDIGGRFSALSYFGLVPAALAGIDIAKLLYYASCVEASAHPCISAERNPLVVLGAALGELARLGRDKATFFLSKELKSFGLWLEQLIAESTGKEGKGIVPVVNEPIGRPQDYGNDRVFISISYGEDRKTARALKELNEAGHPVISFEIKDLYEIGGEFLRWEVATSVAGGVLGINPFDQPDVELSKRLTVARLNMLEQRPGDLTPPGVGVDGKGIKVYFGKAAFERIKKQVGKDGDARKALKEFMGLMEKGDYIGLLAYHNTQDHSIEKGLEELRRELRDRTHAATQSGFGPRYLHSTGQLHKGGANKGLFIILCHRTGKDVRIPGSAFSFSELELSQAFGDMEALDSKGCRVALIDLKDPEVRTLKEAESFLLSVL